MDKIALVPPIVKVPIEEEPIDLFKVKIVQEVIIERERQFVLDLKIDSGCKIDLESLLGPLVGQTVLIIVQGFHLA